MSKASTIAVAALTLLFAPLGAADDCVVDAGSHIGSTAEAGLQVIVPENWPGPLDAVQIRCDGGQVSALELALPAGTVGELILLVGVSEGQRQSVRLDQAVAWARLESQSADAENPDRLRLRVEAPRDARVGASYSAGLAIDPPCVDAERNRGSIPLRLKVLESLPLFRDQFDVDPVIGQFSQVH